MSARDYKDCPNCLHYAEKARQTKAQEAKAKYGKVSVDEFDRLRDEVKLITAPTDTLAQYYEIGVDPDLVFRLSYDCRCSACGYWFSYRAEKIALNGEEVAKLLPNTSTKSE